MHLSNYPVELCMGCGKPDLLAVLELPYKMTQGSNFLHNLMELFGSCVGHH
jgi:hypothetical protein